MHKKTITSPGKAIKAKCLDCCCGQWTEVKECAAKECPLHPFRSGKNPYRKQREISEEQRRDIANRLAEARKKNNDNYNENQ